MEKSNLTFKLCKDQIVQNQEAIIEGLDLEYSKNHTISGYLNNMREHMSEQYSEDAFYQFYYMPKMHDDLARTGKKSVPIVSYSNDNWLYRNRTFMSFYISLVNMHPCYDNKDDLMKLNKAFLKICDLYGNSNMLPHFYRHNHFIYSDLMRNPDCHYTSESKKVYLDVGSENFDNLHENILKLYCDVRKRIDKDSINCRYTNANEFKTRLGYANDGIVFRFFTNKDYEIFKEELSKNLEILKALRSSNPFMPVEYIDWHPFNVIPDMGGSFNDFVVQTCGVYISRCIKEEKDVSLKGFLVFMKNNIVSMASTDPLHYKSGIYNTYRKIMIKQAEKNIK